MPCLLLIISLLSLLFKSTLASPNGLGLKPAMGVYLFYDGMGIGVGEEDLAFSIYQS